MKAISIISVISILLITLLNSNKMAAQSSNKYMRIANITVDSTQLDPYLVLLKEQMNAALKLEKGVLAYSAVQDKKNPSKITILETYASVAAYEAHTQAPHFKKYKATVENIVTSLELIEVVPIAVEEKK